MRFVHMTIVALAVLGIGHSFSYGASAKEYISREHKIRVAFPASWTLNQPMRNEIWLASGAIRGILAGCFVRFSAIENLELVAPDAYFRQMDEKAFVKLNSIATPDIRVHLFNFSYLGDRKARRIIYSGTDDSVKVGNLVHQTLHGNRIITFTCFTEQKHFQFLYNELETVVASFRFLK